MHVSDRYGYLSMNGLPIPSTVLAKRSGCDSLEQYDALLAELESASIPSRTSNGVIFCPAMVQRYKDRQTVKIKWRQQKRKQRKSLPLNGNVRKMSAECPPLSSSSLSLSFENKNNLVETDASTAEVSKSDPQKAKEREVIESVWRYYLRQLGKNSAILSFSPARRLKGMARLKEALAKAGGDLGKAEALMRAAIDALAKSDFHRGANDRQKAYDSWEKNLFPSLEKFESWLEKS